MINNLPKMICFDMDGTIAQLYAVPNWLARLNAQDPTPYLEAEAMWNMAQLAKILSALQNLGVEIRIITWLSKESTEEYKNAVDSEKLSKDILSILTKFTNQASYKKLNDDIKTMTGTSIDELLSSYITSNETYDD